MTQPTTPTGGLEGLSVIVTGGGTGIGRACAARLARDGAAVTICGRRENLLLESVHRPFGIQLRAEDLLELFVHPPTDLREGALDDGLQGVDGFACRTHLGKTIDEAHRLTDPGSADHAARGRVA